MPSFREWELTYRGALERLLPKVPPEKREKFFHPPRGWLPWEGGSDALSKLNLIIGGHLKTRQAEIGAEGIRNLHWLTLQVIAVDAYCAGRENDYRSYRGDLEKAKDREVKTADGLKALLSRSGAETGDKIRESIRCARRQIDQLSAELERLPAPASPATRSDSAVWREAFIQLLGFLWKRLTGTAPPASRATGSGFENLVETILEVFEFVGDKNTGKVLSSRAIQNAVVPLIEAGLGKGFDRFDYPPGPREIAAAQKERYQKRLLDFENNTLLLLEEAKSDDPRRASQARVMLEWREHMPVRPGGPTMRQMLEAAAGGEISE